MKLGTKITFAALVAVVLTTAGAFITVRSLAAKNRIKDIHNGMDTVLQQAEEVAIKMDDMHKSEVFDMAALIQRAREQSGGRPLKETYAQTDLYKVIPIVASWASVEKAAAKEGYLFTTPTRPGLPARNPKNEAGDRYAEAFKAFEAGATEHFVHDKENDEIIFARPVRLAASCLACHGDPANSPTNNGLDILGFPMENMKEGDIKGAFVLKAKLGDDPVVAATSKAMGLVSLGIMGFVGVGFWAFNRRFVNQPLQAAIDGLTQGSAQVTSAAGQITSSSQSLAKGASEQAASLEETAASIEEMASMTKRNADSAAQAKELSAQTRAAADAGTADMEQMQTAMGAIKDSSNEIAKIVKTIDEIAFQTNILALNAAVEAARAGEAGAGFAVVAEEVRNLAQRSAESAKETAAKIEDSVSKSEHGVRISAKVGASLQQIVERARQMDTLVAEIANASKEQSHGLEQVNTAVSHMDKLTQSNAAGAEESASAAEQLSAQSTELKNLVIALQSLVGGNGEIHASTHTKSEAVTTATAAVEAPLPPAPKAPRATKRPSNAFVTR